MPKRSPEPFLWLLFSVGGMAAALLIPVLLLVLGVLVPLGWVAAPGYPHVLAVLENPLTRLVLFGLCVFALFHWAHRFRYTLRDGLRLTRFDIAISAACYGGAALGSVVAAYLLIRV